MPSRECSSARSTRPSWRTSCSVSAPGTRVTSRRCPASETACRARDPPADAAVNQTSPPSGDQASPRAVIHPDESTRLWPSRSTTATAPASSPRIGCSMKATRLAARRDARVGEKPGARFVDGSSDRKLDAVAPVARRAPRRGSRRRARSRRAWTDSSTSRGAPPDSESARQRPRRRERPDRAGAERDRHLARRARRRARSRAAAPAPRTPAPRGASKRSGWARRSTPRRTRSSARRARSGPTRSSRRGTSGDGTTAAPGPRAPVPRRYAEATSAANAAATPAESQARERRGPAETSSGAPSAPLSICEKWSRTLWRSRARSRVAAYRSSGSLAMQRSTIQSSGDGDPRAERGQRLGLLADDRGERLGPRRPLEGAPAREHLVDERAERELVGPEVHRLAARLLGRHVARRCRRRRRRASPRSPSGPARLAPLPFSRCSTFARPKSRILTKPSRVTITFSGFRSRWTMPASWAWASASASWAARFRALRTGRAPA